MAAVEGSGAAMPTITAGTVGKPRNWLGVFFLSLITLGIYGLVWQYKTFQEMKDYGGEGVGGALGLIFAIVLGFVNIFLMPSEVGNLYERDGQPKPVSGPTGFWVLLPLVGGFVWLYKVQTRLSEFWVAHGAVAT